MRRRRTGWRDLINSRSHLGGVVATARAAARRLPWLAPAATLLAATMKRYTDAENRRFDERYGTDSFTRLDLAQLGVEERTGYDFAGWGTCPVNESFFHEMMRATPVDLAQYTFIDIGAGKGKALMLATEFPFRRVVGIELAQELVEVAHRNLARYRDRRPRPVAAELICQDFLRWELPPEPSVLFFNDPFPFPIAERAIGHVEASLRARPRPLVVIYRKAEDAVLDRLDASALLSPVRGSPYWRIYAHAA